MLAMMDTACAVDHRNSASFDFAMQIDTEAKKILNKRLEDSTLSGKASAMNCLRKFFSKMNVDPVSFQQKIQSEHWPAEVVRRHYGLLVGFMTFATRTHKTAKAAITYARDVQDCWKNSTGVDLWNKEQRESLSGFERGLAKLKKHVVDRKLGFSAPDVLALCGMLDRWSKSFTRVSKVGGDLWEERLSSTCQAQQKLAYGVTYRFGETASPQVDDFDPLIRLTRADFIIQTNNSGVRSARIIQPQHKCATKGEYADLECVFDYSDPLNWAVAIERMILADPIAAEHLSITPLFRDSRKSPAIGGGFYAHAGENHLPKVASKNHP